MAELRWTLLGIGAVFVLGLLLWERYKRGRSSRSHEDGSASYPARSQPGLSKESPHANPNDSAQDRPPAHRAQRETRPESWRESPQQLPVVDIDDAEAAAAAAQRQLAAQRHRAAQHAEHETEADIDDMGDLVSMPLDERDDMHGMRVESMVAEEHGAMEDPAGRAEQWIAAAGVRSLRAEDLKLAWPPEKQRTVVALRVEARGTERLGGRAVRQSLLGEGFIFGSFDIFHLPLANGRVIVSAASLTKPGSFSLPSIDAQTFLGLNLFCVLPGPLAGAEALERLVASGRLLAQRLRADLLDTQGQPLTEARLTEMRSKVEGMRAVDSAAPPGTSTSTAAGEPV